MRVSEREGEERVRESSIDQTQTLPLGQLLQVSMGNKHLLLTNQITVFVTTMI